MQPFTFALLPSVLSLFAFVAIQSTASASIVLQIRDGSGLGNGAKCSVSTQCASGNCNRARCADKQRNGHACYKDAGCLSGACFNDHTCYTPGQGTLGNGSKCSTSASCASDNCSRAECHDKQPNGASCYKAANCLSNNCVSGACSAAPPPVTSTTTTTTTTSASSPTSTTPTSSPTSKSITCTKNSDGENVKLLNVNSFEFDSVDPRAFPNPYETFQFNPNSLAATPRTASPLLVTLYTCTSTFMGYRADTSNPNAAYTYGQVRIPSLNNQCLTASSPGASSTSFTHAPCSTLDDASQIAHFFRFFSGDEGVALDYLGATFAASKSTTGKSYGQSSGSMSGKGATLVLQAGRPENGGLFVGR